MCKWWLHYSPTLSLNPVGTTGLEPLVRCVGVGGNRSSPPGEAADGGGQRGWGNPSAEHEKTPRRAGSFVRILLLAAGQIDEGQGPGLGGGHVERHTMPVGVYGEYPFTGLKGLLVLLPRRGGNVTPVIGKVTLEGGHDIGEFQPVHGFVRDAASNGPAKFVREHMVDALEIGKSTRARRCSAGTKPTRQAGSPPQSMPRAA